MVVPAVILLLALCLSAMQLSGTRMLLQDAAAVAARTIARGDPATAASRVAGLVPGATIAIERGGALVCVRLRTQGSLAGGVFAAVPLTASSCALDAGR